MNEEEISKLHRVLLLILREIDRVCRKNSIKYSLIGGSMLGAVRHKGFIPWDDDLDVGMMRSEYERFIAACAADLDSRFELQTNENDPNYVYGFAKILLKDTYLLQYGHERTKHRKGIYVDVFPYDYIPADPKLRKRQSRKNYILTRMLRRKFGSRDERKWGVKEKVAFALVDFANLFISQEKLVRKLNKNMTEYAAKPTKEVSNMSGFYGYAKETVPAAYFDSFTYLTFVDGQFPVVSEYDAFLTSYYGDYMQLPPEDKRRTHGFRRLDFGPYDNI